MTDTRTENAARIHLPLVHSGKVRDTYALGDDLLMVASDRVSAFDVIMPTSVPDKGRVLTQLSRFWFEQTADLVPNHLLTTDMARVPNLDPETREATTGRSMLVKRCDRIDIECVIRGYLAGSAWNEYRVNGTVAGVSLPPGLIESAQLPEPIFTPALKNDTGHDENISVADLRTSVGSDLAEELEQISLALYERAASIAVKRGLLVADTKFEFGFRDGELTLIDELLTPDSSRYWSIERYQPGGQQESLDKQYLRDWLLASGWDKEPPGPTLPPDVVEQIRQRYFDAYRQLVGEDVALSRAVTGQSTGVSGE